MHRKITCFYGYDKASAWESRGFIHFSGMFCNNHLTSYDVSPDTSDFCCRICDELIDDLSHKERMQDIKENLPLSNLLSKYCSYLVTGKIDYQKLVV